MTVHILCLCGHALHEHDDDLGVCLVEGCDCEGCHHYGLPDGVKEGGGRADPPGDPPLLPWVVVGLTCHGAVTRKSRPGSSI